MYLYATFGTIAFIALIYFYFFGTTPRILRQAKYLVSALFWTQSRPGHDIPPTRKIVMRNGLNSDFGHKKRWASNGSRLPIYQEVDGGASGGAEEGVDVGADIGKAISSSQFVAPSGMTTRRTFRPPSL